MEMIMQGGGGEKKMRDLLQKLEVELKPLTDQLSRVKDLHVPEFGTLQAWEVRANAIARASNGDSAKDPSKFSQGGYNGTPMPFLGETKVEVAFSGVDDKDNVKTESGSAPLKVFPPWMIKQGMNLTKEQRGEARENRMDGTSAAAESSDDKKSIAQEDDVKNLQDEYFKAYYAALLERQREQEEATKSEQELPSHSNSDGVDASHSERQVGMKSKRSGDEEGDDGVEWEEEKAPAAGEAFKVNDLNVDADASEENNEEDDIDWEEG